MHRSGDLIGFVLLAVDAGTGLLGDGRQLFSGTGDLCHAIAQTTNQLAQVTGHAHHAALQLAQFVLAGNHLVVRQITISDTLGQFQCFTQRAYDKVGNDPCRQGAHDQCCNQPDREQHLGLTHILHSQVDLVLGQLVSAFKQDADVFGDACLSQINPGLRRGELIQGVLVADHRVHKVLDDRRLAIETLQISDKLDNRVHRCFRWSTVFRLQRIGVATQVEAHFLEQRHRLHDGIALRGSPVIGSGNGVELLQIISARIGVLAKHRTGRLTGSGCLHEVVVVNTVILQGVCSSIHQRYVQRRIEHLLRVLHMIFETFERFQPVAGALGVIVDRIGQSGNADISRECAQLADVGNPLASFTQRGDACPACQRNQHRQYDDQSKPEHELGPDRNIAQSIYHRESLFRWSSVEYKRPVLAIYTIHKCRQRGFKL